MADEVLPSTMHGAGGTGHFALHAVMYVGGSGEFASIQTHSQARIDIHTQLETLKGGPEAQCGCADGHVGCEDGHAGCMDGEAGRAHGEAGDPTALAPTDFQPGDAT